MKQYLFSTNSVLVSVIFWLHSGSRLVLLFIVLPEETDSERLKDLPLDIKVVSGGVRIQARVS